MGLDPADRAVVAGWSAAEQTLYGPLLADPPAYERVVALVGVLVNHLRATVDDLSGLLTASRRGADLVAEVEPEAALPWLPLEAAVRAACALRHRELLVVEQQEKCKQMLGEAVAAGEPWVRIVDVASTAVPAVAPALIVHVPSGRSIRCTTEMDLDTGGARFVSSPVTVDLRSGEVIGPLDGVGGERSAPTLPAREAQISELQRAIEALDTGGRVV